MQSPGGEDWTHARSTDVPTPETGHPRKIPLCCICHHCRYNNTCQAHGYTYARQLTQGPLEKLAHMPKPIYSKAFWNRSIQSSSAAVCWPSSLSVAGSLKASPSVWTVHHSIGPIWHPCTHEKSLDSAPASVVSQTMPELEQPSS